MKIAMGCAKVAYDLKEAVKAHLLGRGFEVVDFCEDPADPMPYAEVAARAAQGMPAPAPKETTPCTARWRCWCNGSAAPRTCSPPPPR